MVPPKYGVWDAAREILAELTFILPGYLEAKSSEREDWTAILATSRLSVIATSVDAPAVTVFVAEPLIRKPPERLAAADTSAKVPL